MLALLSLAALLLVILVSCVSRLNVGILAIACAWAISRLAGVDANTVLSGFPSSLFLTLTGVTLLFTQAEVNGTLARLAQALTRLARGSAFRVLVLFFFFAAFLSTIGAGALATAAILAPLAMGAAARAGISPFLMAVVLGNGANAGNLSPVSPVGVILAKTLERTGLSGLDWLLYRNHFFAHILITAIVVAAFGGRALWRQSLPPDSSETQPWQRSQILTVFAVAALLAGVLLAQVPVGLGAFAAASLLTLLRCAPEDAVLKKIPWGIILMVCGMSLLVALLERTGGLDLFVAFIARFSTPLTLPAVVAFSSGVISAYSSTSGVVLPAFLPMAPRFIEQTGGGDLTAVLSSIGLGSHLVDVSPLSTIGALAIAAAGESVDRQLLFRHLLLWGLSMCLFGAVASFILFGGLFS